VATTIEYEAPPLSRSASGQRVKLAIVLLTTLVMAALVIGHVGWTNGPWYWKWPWRRLSVWPLYPLVAVASVPFFVAQYLYARKGWRAARVLPLLMLSTFALMLVTCFCQPLHFGRIAAIIENFSITSYYYVAARLARSGVPTLEWMDIYPQFMMQLPVHGGAKPPGLILYHLAFIKLLGDNVTAQTAAGVLIGLLGTLTVPATYLLVRALADDEPAGLASASFMALCPSLILQFPLFDQIYPAAGCLAIYLWWRALRTARLRYGLAFGALLFVMTMMSHVILVTGAMLGAMTLLHVGTRRTPGAVTAVVQGAISMSLLALLYILLHAATGFDPIETLTTIAAYADHVIVQIRRPWPTHMIFDVYDFALGTAWISFVLAAIYVTRVRRTFLRWPLHDAGTRLAFLALFQIFTFAAGAFLPGEAARLWLILMPLLAVPVGLELARWGYAARMTVFACELLLMTLICQNMILINIGENLKGKQIGVPDEKGHVSFE
jgi:hypothetical protein